MKPKILARQRQRFSRVTISIVCFGNAWEEGVREGLSEGLREGISKGTGAGLSKGARAGLGEGIPAGLGPGLSE